MFERKLIALQYDFPSVDVKDEKAFRNIIYWLECRKIRLYSPDQRESIHPDSQNWNQSFEKYLDDLQYKGIRDDKKIVLDRLLNLSLRYEMEDTQEKIQMSNEQISDLINLNNAEDISNVDINSPEFLNELKDLSNILNVPFYEEEPLVTLRAIAILLCKLRKSSINSEQQEDSPKVDPAPNKKIKMANNTDEKILQIPFGKNRKYDPILNRCANVLRLLYIKDLRELQTNVNNSIVQVQSMTANPKTDSTLGKVGR